MLKKILFALFLLSLLSSVYTQSALPQEETVKIFKTVFEVVTEKPAEDNLKYEKELPLDLIPYQIRNDKFTSIGTAFAVGENIFLSAAHVLSLHKDSISREIYLRDGNGDVFPLKEILKYDTHKDYALFSVKDMNNDIWLDLSQDIEINSPVYAVGNAGGEGVIIRGGLFTSRTPEEEQGKWKWMRYSAAASPGNSGGPLLDSKGNVVGIVTAKSENENYNYALPISETLPLQSGPGNFHLNFIYTLPNLSFRQRVREDIPIELPNPITSVRQDMQRAYKRIVSQSLNKLMESNKSEIFPYDIIGSDDILTNTYATTFPGIIYEKDDSSWHLSQPEDISSSDLGAGSYLNFGPIWGDTFWELKLPDNETIDAYLNDPSKLMDTFLSGNKITRNVGSEKIRINSLGHPSQTEKYIDIWGRKWQANVWEIPFANYGAVLLTLPTPSGAVGLFKLVGFDNVYSFLLDFKEMANFINVSYYASFYRWKLFLNDKDIFPENFKNIELKYDSGQEISFSCSSLQFAYDNDFMKIQDESELYLIPSFYNASGKIVWDISRIFAYEDQQGSNLFGIERQFKPIDEHDDEMAEEWQDLVQKNYPYGSGPIVSKGNSYIFDVMNIIPGEENSEKLSFLWSAYMKRKGELEDDETELLFSRLKNGIVLTEDERERALFGSGITSKRVDIPRIDGKTIFQAISLNDYSLFQKFVSGGYDLEVRNNEGQTPIMLALQMTNISMIRDLFKEKVKLDAQDQFGRTAPHLALLYQEEELCLELIKLGPNMATLDNDNYTPLMTACKNKMEQAALAIIANGVPLNILNDNGRSALYYALFNGLNDAATLMLDNGAPVNIPENDDYSMLMAALAGASEKNAQRLLDAGTFRGGLSAKKWTPLQIALRNGKETVARQLIADTPDINSLNDEGWAVIHTASRNCSLESVKLLIENGADISLITSENYDVLMLALSNKEHPEVADFYLVQNISCDTIDEDGWSALIYALRYGAPEQAEKVYNRTSVRDGTSSHLWNPLMYAVRYGKPELALKLIDDGNDVNRQSDANVNPLSLAAEYSTSEVVKKLLKAGANSSAITDTGMTPLMEALSAKRNDTAEILINAGSPLDTVSDDGWTPLREAIRYCSEKIILLLIEKGAPINLGVTSNGWNDLHISLRYSTGKVIDAVLADSDEINKMTNSGWTALHFAARYNSAYIGRLLNKGADMSIRNVDGFTPLHLAVRQNNVDAVRKLLAAGALTDLKDNDGKTPKDYAESNWEILKLFDN